VREALSKEQRQQELNRRTLSFKKSLQYLSLHVKGFRLGTTAQEVIDFFHGQSGQEVKGVKITNTGAALVSFTDREAARVAKERINGALFNGRELEAYYFEPRELRELQKLKLMD
jgi:hypothetical protein